MEYKLGEIVFKTKAEAQSTVRGYLASAGTEQRITGAMDVLLRCLLLQHPHADEKIGPGIDYFLVVVRPDAFNSKGFDIRRVDGSQIDFSYRECFNPSSRLVQVLGALRHEVDEQMLAARKKFFGNDLDNLCACALTGKMLSSAQAHMDHAYPFTFSKICEDFIKREGLSISGIELTQGELFDNLTDRGLAQRWIAFHAQTAILRPVEKQENIKNSNRSPNAK